MILPSGLQRLAFGSNFNFNLDNVRLPRRLQHFASGILASIDTPSSRQHPVFLNVKELEGDGVRPLQEKE